MQASSCLKAPQLSATLHRPRSALQRRFVPDNFLALRRKTNFPYGSHRAILRPRASSSTPAPPPCHQSSNHSKTLALVAGAAVATVALAGVMGCIFPSWSRRGRISLAAPWHNVPIISSAERGRPEPKSDQELKEMQNQVAADQVLLEMLKRKDLPEKFYKITPNYLMIKEYFEGHLRLSDESWETLIKKWKEISPGQDQIEIGLLLIDICIIKGDVTIANDIDMEINKIVPELDQRPKIRRDIVNMIKDWDKKTEWEKKLEWEKFAKNMQNVVRSPSINEPSIDEPDEEP